jgi:hypothetical protein
MSAEITDAVTEHDDRGGVFRVPEHGYLLIRLRDGRKIRVKEIEDGIEVYSVGGRHSPMGTLAVFAKSSNVIDVKVIDHDD